MKFSFNHFFQEIKIISPVCYYGFSTYEGRMFRPKSFIDRTILVMFKVSTFNLLFLSEKKLWFNEEYRMTAQNVLKLLF